MKYHWNEQDFKTKAECEKAIETEVAEYLCNGGAGSVEVEGESGARCLNIRIQILPQ